MGPNGSGKSTLANVLAGNEDYKINSGKIIFKDEDLLNLNIEERAQKGIFLAFQYPVEIPGVNITPFLQASINSKLKNENKPELDSLSFAKLLRKKAEELGIDTDMLKRSINTGFSGGEKKRYEILQMSVLDPEFTIFDETDSGLDVDALKIVTEGNDLKVLKGAIKTLKKHKPKLIQIEMNYHYLFSGENLYQFSILLKDYDIYQIMPFNNGLLKIDPTRPENNIFHLSNFIFKKKN